MFANVFKSYPGVQIIYVVDGMPFLTEREAYNYAVRAEKDVEEVHRNAGEELAEQTGAAPEKPASQPRSSARPRRKKS